MIHSLYLHFPFCVKLCNYCDFYKNILQNAESELPRYHQFLNKSWEQLASFLKDHGKEVAPLETIFIGGGTPSLWGEQGISFLRTFFQENKIKKHPHLEFSIEVNPESGLSQHLESWEDIGVNRFSVGVQTLDAALLPHLNRAHDVGTALKLIDFLGQKQKNFSVDLMLGLPFSGSGHHRNIKEELKMAVDSGAQHMSCYILTPKGNYIYKNELPGEEYIREEYLTVCDYLESQGFLQYEVSNFSKPGKECQHNLRYWINGEMLALGPSGVGQIRTNPQTEAQVQTQAELPRQKHTFCRYRWGAQGKGVETKAPLLELEPLTAEQVALEELYLSLRLTQGTDLRRFFPPEQHAKLLDLGQSWQSRGLGYWNGQKISLNSQGFIVLDSLIEEVFSITRA